MTRIHSAPLPTVLHEQLDDLLLHRETCQPGRDGCAVCARLYAVTGSLLAPFAEKHYEITIRAQRARAV
jgi:hypothetical protein